MTAVLLAVAVIILISCKGAQGPAGANGAPGTEFMEAFQQGQFPTVDYNGVKDSYISDAYPNTNWGTCTTMTIGTESGYRYRSVIYFDVSLVTPVNAVVTRAYLTLNGAGADNVAGLTITAYPLTRFFAEGNGTCAGALDGTDTFVTWLRWATPGGTFGNAMSNSQFYDPDADGFTLFQLTLDPSVVQGWIQNPLTNFGMMLMSVENTGIDDTIEFSTKEDNYYGLSFRPKLTIFYTLP